MLGFRHDAIFEKIGWYLSVAIDLFLMSNVRINVLAIHSSSVRIAIRVIRERDLNTFKPFVSGSVMAGKNVLGTELQECSTDPMTGFYRDGCPLND